MAFYQREYDLYVLLGSAEASPIWRWSEWSRAASILSPVMAAAKGKPAVRCIQLSAAGSRKISFGRLGWDDKSHQKWSHCSPSNASESTGWRFLGLEVWAPAWTACEREKTAPDVFFSMANQELGSGFNQPLAFNPAVVLAVCVELTDDARQLGKRATLDLASLVQAKLAVTKQRTWGRPFGSIGFTDAINDLGVTGLFKVGNRHQRPVNLTTFDEPFELLNR